jgi:hypothetical protein
MSAHGHMVEVTPSMSLKDVSDAYHDKMMKATRPEGSSITYTELVDREDT